MRFCLFSDIHGNMYAFDEFLKLSSKLEIDQYIYCGDIFGYYYQQDIILTSLGNIKNLICIRGNHDNNYINICNGSNDEKIYINKYGNSYNNVTGKISPSNHNFVEKMPIKYELNCSGLNIGIFHGSPTDELNGRIYPDSIINDIGSFQKYDYVILGHTHFRMKRCIGKTLVINPGSVGQARDKYGSSFATLDLPEGNLIFYNINWNQDRLINDIRTFDPRNSKLIEILYRNEMNK